MFRCPKCGRYVKGESIGRNKETGSCKKCNVKYNAEGWHYFDETGEAVCGCTVRGVIF